jgi:hypothetical protein
MGVCSTSLYPGNGQREMRGDMEGWVEEGDWAREGFGVNLLGSVEKVLSYLSLHLNEVCAFLKACNQ